jgi:hypothetical protein
MLNNVPIWRLRLQYPLHDDLLLGLAHLFCEVAQKLTDSFAFRLGNPVDFLEQGADTLYLLVWSRGLGVNLYALWMAIPLTALLL